MKIVMPEETLIVKLRPYFDALPAAVKAEKDKQRMTNQDLADASGVPLSNVGKFLSDTLEKPNVFYVAAVCAVLGLSLDKLLGLSQDASERKITPNNEKSEKEQKETAPIKLILALLIMNFTLTAFLMGYIVFDARNPSVGLFRGSSGAPSVFLILLVVAFVLFAVSLIRARKK